VSAKHEQHGPPAQHRAYAPSSLGCSVLTVSDTRTAADDSSGDLIQSLLLGAGHKVLERAIVRDEREAIARAARAAIARADIDALLVSGGTGVAPRDCTIEALQPLLYKQLDGFGELFRMLSFEQIGPAAMLSRALAGSADRTAVFALPGSSGAVRLALERLILPELPHRVGQLRR
jgi:molybdenum cofactor biosynthesis protein B